MLSDLEQSLGLDELRASFQLFIVLQSFFQVVCDTDASNQQG